MKWDELTTSERERIGSEIIQEQKRGFGLRIHLLRTALGFGVKEFSKRCGVTVSYISRIEGGSRSNPSHKVVDSIVKAFPVMHVWLVYGRGPILEPKQHRRLGFDPKEVGILEKLERKERENLLTNQGKSIRELVDTLRLSNKDLVDLIEASKSADAGSSMGDGVARMLTEALVQRLSTHGEENSK
jgi:transcriptional regulator with XRE-family HTH domain